MNIFFEHLRMKKILSILLLFLLILVSTGSFAAVRDREKKDKKSKKEKADHPTSSLSLLVDAKREAITGNKDRAIDLFRQYIEKFPQDPVACFELSRILAENKEIQESLKFSRLAHEMDPDNLWYSLFLAEMDQITGNLEEAISIYEKVVGQNPAILDFYYQLAALYLSAEKFKDAIELYDRIEIKAGKSEEVSLQKQKIYLHLKEFNKAEKELTDLVRSKPEDPRYLSILAEFYMSNNKPEKALETYKKISEIDPGNPYIHISMADYYRKKGDMESAFQELRDGFENPSLDVDTKVNILISFYTVNQMFSEHKEQTFILTKTLVDVHPNDPKTHSIYGDFLAEDKRYAEAREEFLTVIRLDSNRYVAWEDAMRMDILLEKYDHLLELSNSAVELFPEQPLPFLFSGMANFQLRRYLEAVTSFKRGVRLVVNNDELLSQFYMYIGDSYHSLKNTEESDKAYEKSLSLKYDNPYVLNNYAYYLSVRNTNLKQAEIMSKKSLELDSLNYSFMDTYGWILYRLGHYQDAKFWVGKALKEKEQSSAEVLEHYGDILYRLGETDKALEYWQKAKTTGPGSEFLDKKIMDKKIYE